MLRLLVVCSFLFLLSPQVQCIEVSVLDTKDEPTFVEITEQNMKIYLNLAQAYEAEFSNLTEKLPTRDGIFEPDTMPRKPYIGFLLYWGAVPGGFCIVNISDDPNDVAEFYVIPSMRRKGYGRKMAEMVFKKYPGRWQVRQIEGAHRAVKFWRRVIRKFTGGAFQEAVVEDKEWGIVTRQLFESSNLKEKK